jgi:hypothetical protein
LDPRALIAELIDLAAALAGREDPLDAEVLGAAFVSLGANAGEPFEEALIEGFIPAFEAAACEGALAMLLAIGAVCQGRAAKAASTAAGRLVDRDVTAPRWPAELAKPVTITDAVRLRDTHVAASILACSFHRGARSHAILLTVDELDCGAAGEIAVLDVDQVTEALDAARTQASDAGWAIEQESLGEADFRWHVENALDARTVHDAEPDLDRDLDRPTSGADEDGPGYPAMAVLLLARMVCLTAPDKPTQSHQDGGSAALALPGKAVRAGQPAPVYRIKVDLRGSKPLIWRRLELPADTSLAELHRIIQVAFDWDDYHQHLFSTPYGDFGASNAGYRSEASVTLEQVAPGARNKISYVYDLGDG